MSQPSLSAGREREPHVPVGRLDDGTWVHAPYGAMLPVEAGRRVVCHACGDALSAISAQHARRHGLTLEGYRERFGLNRKQSLTAPELADKRRVEGRRRWAHNNGVRDGLAVGQLMAKSGVLYELGAAAQPAGARRPQGRAAASRDGASAALRADREHRTQQARARWAEQARALGFTDLEEYLTQRRTEGATAHRVRSELGCGGRTAERLLAGPAG
ncbi:MucR family transcriptional regulator [Phycicoccus sp. SLBN-51]|uniref:MucR family transcriptional regulator n=1 Tax=Phycicoccus sp. SLBN-51 TaxID=2768447 RepID=UPI001153E4C1|nr:MucR family transcriptional regulator [Phycicoccus sp. SLBN-51]TQJ49280.1 ROS/MUCR transcriptional regulator protein [Phycicoccus sp. SLBN-51]